MESGGERGAALVGDLVVAEEKRGGRRRRSASMCVSMQGWEMAREWALGEKAASRDYSWSGTPPFPSPPLADGAAAP